jgi:hypothetical protein
MGPSLEGPRIGIVLLVGGERGDVFPALALPAGDRN